MPDKILKIRVQAETNQLERLSSGLDAITDIVGTLSKLMRDSTSQINQFADSLLNASKAGSSVSSLLSSLGGQFSKFSGPIDLAVRSMMLVIDVFQKNELAAENARRATKEASREIIESLHELGRVSSEEYLNYLETQKKIAEGEVALAKSKVIVGDIKLPATNAYGIGSQMVVFFGDLLGSTDAARSQQQEEIEKAEAKVLEIEKQINRFKNTSLDTTKEITEEIVKQAELSEVTVMGTMPTPQPTGTTPQSLFGGVELGKPAKVQGGMTTMEDVVKHVDLTFAEIIQASGIFQQSFSAGMQSVGQSINQSVGGMFRGVFGEANSLLEIFIANFVTSMAKDVLSLLTGGATGGILSILGFAKGGIINEPIFGIGKSGQRYLFGEVGSEAVVPFSEAWICPGAC